MPHGPAQSTAFRFECDGKSVCYATDFSEITDEMIALAADCDVLVVDCLRRASHPTHANLATALDFAERSCAKRAVLTHLDKSMDYATLTQEVPAKVAVAFDGMVIEP